MDDVHSRHVQSLYTCCRRYLDTGDDQPARAEQLLAELVSLDARHPGTIGAIVAAMLRLPLDRFAVEQRPQLEMVADTWRGVCDRRMANAGRLDSLRTMVANLTTMGKQMTMPDFASQPNSYTIFRKFSDTRAKLGEHPPENLLAVLADTTDAEARGELERALSNLPGYLVQEARRGMSS